MDKKIYEYSDLIDRDLSQMGDTANEKQSLAEKIKPLLPDSSIVLAQTNPLSGNIEYNALNAKKRIERAENIGADVIVFPELYLIGAPVGDYILKFPVVVEECREWLENLAQNTKKTKCLIGFAEGENDKYYNSVAILANGKIEKIIRKSVLNNIAENNESRYFEVSPFRIADRIVNINNRKACVLIGEEYNLLENCHEIKNAKRY